MPYGRIQRGQMGGDQFTQIANELFRDPRLTFKAKGVFGLISTHRDGFGVSVAAICAMGKDKESAVKAALRELEEYGYLQRTQEKDPTTKKFGSVTYAITDQPQEKNPSSGPVVDTEPADLTSSFTAEAEPSVDFPPAGSTPAENPVGKKTNPEGVVHRASPGGTSPEEHSLRAARSEAALPGGESEMRGRPSIPEITGPGASVAFAGRPQGHTAGCLCITCQAVDSARRGPLPQQPTDSECLDPRATWLNDMFNTYGFHKEG